MYKTEIRQQEIDVFKVPKKILYNGDTIPSIGLGTFGSDRFSGEEIASAVKGAFESGYRHFDCASVYGNQHLIGKFLKEILRENKVKREELWITSKIWNDCHAEEKVLSSLEQTLRELQLDYLDLYLIHWPFANHHPPKADPNWRDSLAKPYIHEEYMKTWRQMEELVKNRLVRHIGTSNMTIQKLDLLLRDAKIKPSCNQMELHPHFQQPELFEYCLNNQIVPIGYAPIGSPTRPDRDKTPEDTSDLEDSVIIEIAKGHKIHPAVVCVKWAVQRGQIPIPFSVYRGEYLSNLRSVVEDPLTSDEMKRIKHIDKNCRLIKGQVFLWPEAQDWTCLWDMGGEINSPNI